MCHETYTTQEMNLCRSQEFAHWFSFSIGTYFERNSTDVGFYFTCFELNLEEFEKIQAWENQRVK